MKPIYVFFFALFLCLTAFSCESAEQIKQGQHEQEYLAAVPKMRAGAFMPGVLKNDLRLEDGITQVWRVHDIRPTLEANNAPTFVVTVRNEDNVILKIERAD